ncbi:MAG: GNAT family N-acetyltransferase [Desulfovibrionales bacterium]|nr:GNAT family N-acetyltransferase [Desulfovibrionales bacterium]
MEIHIFQDEQAMEVANVFHAAVHAIDPSIYSEEEKEAWAPTPPNYYEWGERLKGTMVFTAIVDDTVAGFIALEPNGHIDFMYTHPQYQNMGVAAYMYEYVLDVAQNLHIARLTVDASKIAKTFFEERGFELQEEKLIERNGLSILHYAMEKRLL